MNSAKKSRASQTRPAPDERRALIALTVPPVQSDLAAPGLKDPYLFDMLGASDPRGEAGVEQALVDDVQLDADRMPGRKRGKS